MNLKKNTFYILGTIFLIIVGVVIVMSNSTQLNPSLVVQSNSDAQVVKLSVKNGNYVLEPSEIKKGVLTRIEADMSAMPGCSKSVRIPAFKVTKTFNSNSNTVEFTPDKTGTFNIACSMNMYKGTFTVLESDGSKSNFVETAPSSGGSCGASGGGCGCGG